MPRLKDFNSVDELAQSPREFKVSLVGDLDSLVNHFGAEHREELYTKIVRCSPVFEHAVNLNLNGLMGSFFDYLANDLDDLVKHFGEDYKEDLYTKIIRHSLFFEYALNFNLDGLMWHFGNHKEFLYDQVACRDDGLILYELATKDLDGVMRHFGDDENKKHELYTEITGNNRVLSYLVRYNLDGLMRHFGAEHKEDLFNKIIYSNFFDDFVSNNLDGLVNNFFEYKDQLLEAIQKTLPRYEQACNEKIAQRQLEDFKLKDFNSVDELAQSPREFKVSLVGDLDSLVNHFGAEHREELYTKIVRCSPVFEHAVNLNLNGLMGSFFDYLANDLDDLVKHFGEDYKEDLYTKIIRHSLFFEYALNFNLDGLMWHFGNHKEFLYDQVACRENGLILNGLATQNLDGVMQHFGEDYKEDLYTKITGNNRVLPHLVRYNLDGLMRHFWREEHKEDLFNKIINFDHFDFENIVSENLNGLMWHFGTEHKEDLFNKIINLYPVCFANIVSKYLDGYLDGVMRHFGDDEYKESLFNNIIYSNYFADFVSKYLDGLVNNFFEYKDKLLERIEQACPSQDQEVERCRNKIEQIEQQVNRNADAIGEATTLPRNIAAKIAVFSSTLNTKEGADLLETKVARPRENKNQSCSIIV